jgi:hypothetical protein
MKITISSAFFGFSMGAILFGITIRQAYQYYVHAKDTKWRRILIGLICLLDTLNVASSMNMIYNFLLLLLGNPKVYPQVMWSLKALATTQVFLILLVQGFYLFQIWCFSGNIVLLHRRVRLAAKAFVILVSLYATAVAVVFLSQMRRVDAIFGFSGGFEYVMYLGFGSTALIDCAIAAAMCITLYKSNTGIRRSESVLESLVQYFVGTGLLTSLAALLAIVLYVARPHSLLYLSVEFSTTKLYANSILAMFNARQSLNERMNESIEVKLPSGVFFAERDTCSQRKLLLANPFSPISPVDDSLQFSPDNDANSDYSFRITGPREDRRNSAGRFTL